MDQREKALVAKLDDLSSTLTTYIVEGEKRFLRLEVCLCAHKHSEKRL